MPLAGSDSILAANMFQLAEQAVGPLPNPAAGIKLHALCQAISTAVVNHIVAMAVVAPGIVSAGSPSTQVSVSPGKVI